MDDGRTWTGHGRTIPKSILDNKKTLETKISQKKRRKKMLYTLVFQYKEDAIRPELFSPARFRVQGGGTLSVTDGQTDGRMNEGNPRV